MAKNKPILHSRAASVAVGLIALIAAWLVWLRASHTGSLQQYGILIVLVIFALNRLIQAVRKNERQ